MPVLSLHNSTSLPTGSVSYTLGLSGAPNITPYTFRTTTGLAPDRLLSGTSAISNLGISSVNPLNNGMSILVMLKCNKACNGLLSQIPDTEDETETDAHINLMEPWFSTSSWK